MAAAVVPPRTRAAARAPQPPSESSPVTYVRLTLLIDTLRGPSLAPDPTQHLFRWLRAGKVVKSTPARPIDASPTGLFSKKMALYARVKRQGAHFVSDDPAEPLQTELELCSQDARKNVRRVSTLPFDVAHYLHEIIQAGAKTMSAPLRLPPDIAITITLTIKALGENFLTPLTGPVEAARHGMAREPRSVDNDEATAALELERLRQDVREREGRINALADSASRLDAAVQEHARQAENSVPAGDFAALQVRINTLEEQRVVAEHERAELERKIAAHVAHAAKIKATYNQLAAWYNNLRKEHTELQKKHPGSAAEQAEGTRDLPTDVSMTHEADVKSLGKERDELHKLLNQERLEKKEMHSRNSELLGEKARTLAELKEQWDSAQGVLVSTKRTSEEQSRQLLEMQTTIDTLKAQLEEKESLVAERSALLSKTEEEAKEREVAHLEAVEQAKVQAAEKARVAAEEELSRLKKAHEDEARKLLEDSNAAGEATLQRELSKINEANAVEIAEAAKKVEEKQQAKHEQELAAVRRECDQKIEDAVHQAEKSVQEAAIALKEVNENLNVIENEKRTLEEQLKALAEQHDAQAKITSDEHQKELQKMRTAKEEMEEQVAQMAKQVAADKDAAKEVSAREKGRNEELEEELKKVLEELNSLRKEKEDIESSPRHIALNGMQLSEGSIELEKENSRLKALLKSESDKRNETANLLASADGEHDELRAMVTRLRQERDEALSEAKRAKDLLSNPTVNVVAVRQGSASSEQEADVDSLSEERDKAMRELFRVRKTLNREIKRLKKENEALTSQCEHQGEVVEQRGLPDVNGADLANLREERDIAVAELQKIGSKLSVVSAEGELEQATAGKSGDIGSQVCQKLEFFADELKSVSQKNVELKMALDSKSDEYSSNLDRVRHEKDQLQLEVQQVHIELTSATSSLEEREKNSAELSAKIMSLDRALADLRRSREATEQERDNARQRATALQTELVSLKDSLDAASSSSSSTEALLRDAQREVAGSKGKIKLLQGEIGELKEVAKKKEREVEEEQSRLLSEKEEKSKENSKLEVQSQKLQSYNASLTAKLAAEKNLKDEALKHLAEIEGKASTLEEEVRSLEEKEKINSEATSKLVAEKDTSAVALSETKKRLELTERLLAEQQAELTEAKGKIKSVESSREVIQKEGIAAGGKSLALTEEIAVLRTELKQTQLELQTSSRDLQVEMNKNSELVGKESDVVTTLKDENRALSAQLSATQLRFESIEDELRVLKDSYSTLESVLQKVQGKATRLSKSVAEKGRECSELNAALAGLKSENERSRTQFDALVEQNKQTRSELASTMKEASLLRGEKQSFVERIRSLEDEIGSMHERLTSLQEEGMETIESERANAEKESKKADELRKEVRAARSKAEALEAEVARLRASYQELLNSSKESGERDGEVLNDLINTRMELAYAQEETIRLKNKLKKVAPGSASFEY